MQLPTNQANGPRHIPSNAHDTTSIPKNATHHQVGLRRSRYRDQATRATVPMNQTTIQIIVKVCLSIDAAPALQLGCETIGTLRKVGCHHVCRMSG